MNRKSKPKSRILAEVHETARDMHDIELISNRRMQEFDALCDLSAKESTPAPHPLKTPTTP